MPAHSDKTELAGNRSLGSCANCRKGSLLFRAAFLGVVVAVAAAVILPLGWAISGNRMGLFAGCGGRRSLLAGGVDWPWS